MTASRFIVKPMPTRDKKVVNEAFGIQELEYPSAPSASPASDSRFNSLLKACLALLLCSASFLPAATFLDL